jgi:hypothetical protein
VTPESAGWPIEHIKLKVPEGERAAEKGAESETRGLVKVALNFRFVPVVTSVVEPV